MAHRGHFYIDAYGLAADAPPLLQQYKPAVVAAAVVHPMEMAAMEAEEVMATITLAMIISVMSRR